MKHRLLAAFFFLIGTALAGQIVPGNLNLIPWPRQITRAPGLFELSPGVSIRAENPDNVGLENFAGLLRSEMGLSVQINPDRVQGRAIRLQKRNDIGFECADEGYQLEIRPDGIEITAPTDAGLFYGIQALSQLVASNRSGSSIPCLIIRDKPDIPVRGWQDDISRGPIPTLDYLKKQVRTLAAFKLNAITLYTEHVFKLKKHPGLAPPDGITQEEIAELSAYAAKYHVQVIGNFQSFGHMEKILSKPGYQHLAEKGHIISPAREESYTFLGEVYSEIVPAYSSPFFNINCDETFGLGEEASKGMADSIGIPGIYGYHINRLNELLKPYNKKILMWGDIAANPVIAAKLPKDITVISWGYHDAPSFDYAIRPFSDQGLNFWVAPGTSCWGNLYPNLKVAEINISNYIRDGYRLGATGVLNTTWDDDGLTLFENNWWPLIYGAEKSWNPVEGTATGLEAAFDKIFFGTRSVSVLSWMRAFSALHQGKVRSMLGDARLFEPVTLFYPEYVSDVQMDLNGDVLARLDSLDALLPDLGKEVVRNRETLEYLKLALAEARFSASRNVFRVELFRYIHRMPGALAAENLKSSLKWLIRETEMLKEGYVRLWNRENRPWWLNRNLAAWDKLSADLRDIRGITILEIDDQLSSRGREIRMRSVLDNLPISYTLDGSEPGPASEKYSEPIFVQQDVTIRARVMAEGKAFPVVADSLVMHKAIGRFYKLNSTWSPYHPAYDAGGKFGLVDGRTGSVSDIRSGRWQGYSGQDISIEIDLGRPETLTSFSMGFYQHTFSWVILPKQLDIYISDDGISYRMLTSIGHTVPVDSPDPVKHVFSVSLGGVKAQYFKAVGVYFGPLPEFHASKGQESMMFADEVVLH